MPGKKYKKAKKESKEAGIAIWKLFKAFCHSTYIRYKKLSLKKQACINALIIIILVLGLSQCFGEERIDIPYPEGGFPLELYPYENIERFEVEEFGCFINVNYPDNLCEDRSKYYPICYYYYSDKSNTGECNTRLQKICIESVNVICNDNVYL